MRVPLPRSPRRAIRLSVALFAAATSAAVMLPTTAANAADPEYYELPSGVNAGTGVTVAPDGTVYFSTNDSTTTPRFGRLVPASAAPGTANGVSLFPTPTTPNSSTQIRALAYDNTDHRLFFTRSDGFVGKAETATLAPNAGTGISAVRATTAGQGLWGIDVDQTTHEAWFTEYGSSNVQTGGEYPGNRVAHATASLAVTELPNLAVQPPRTTLDSLRYDAKPKGIVADGTGGAWFAESDPGNPGWRIGHAVGGSYQEYLVTPCKTGPPCSGSYTGTGITDVALAKDGTVWFTNELDNTIGRLDAVAGSFTQFAMSSIDATLGAGKPRAIRAAPDGALWVAQLSSPYVNIAANALVRIVPGTGAGPATIAATVYKTGDTAPLGLATAANGDVWFAGLTPTTTGRLGRIASGTGPTPGTAPTPTPTPGAGAPTPTPDAGAPTPNPLDPSGPLLTPTPAPGAAPTPTPVVVAAVSVGRAEVGKVNLSGDSLSSNQICVGPPQDKCSLVYLISSHEYVTGFPGTGARLSAPKKPTKKTPKEVELGKTSLTLSGGQTKKVTVRLNAKARKALAKQKRIKATLTVTQKNAAGVFVVVKKKAVTFTVKKAK